MPSTFQPKPLPSGYPGASFLERILRTKSSPGITRKHVLPRVRSSNGRRFPAPAGERKVPAICELAVRSVGELLQLETSQLFLGGPGAGYRLAGSWVSSHATLTPLDPAGMEAIAELYVARTVALSRLDLSESELAAARERSRNVTVWWPLRAGSGDIGVLVGCARRSTEVRPANRKAALLLAAHTTARLEACRAAASPGNA